VSIATKLRRKKVYEKEADLGQNGFSGKRKVEFISLNALVLASRRALEGDRHNFYF
jgi:hypothetical protein